MTGCGEWTWGFLSFHMSSWSLGEESQNVPSRLMRQRRELGPRRLKDPFSLPYRSQTQSWEQVSPQRLCFFSAVLGLQCGLWALQLWCTELVALWPVGSKVLTVDGSCIPCLVRLIHNCWTTGEALHNSFFCLFVFEDNLLVSLDLFSSILGILLVFFIVCYPRPFLSHPVHHPRDSFCFFIVMDPLLPDTVLCWVLLWRSTFSSSILSIWWLLLI